MKQQILQNKLLKALEQFQHHTAIQYRDQAISYGQMDIRSHQVANWLIKKGIKPHTFIGILIDNRVDFITTMIGILKAGCVFMPLESTFPVKRLAVMIRSTHTRFIITDKVNFNKLLTDPTGTGETLTRQEEFLILEDANAAEEFPGLVELPGVSYSPEDPIYVYFTSGTSGSPRAFVGKNKSLLHFIHWEIETLEVNETFHFSQFTNPGFDAFLRDVFVPLCSGGMICIPGSVDIQKSPPGLIAWIERSGIDVIHCVPSLFRTFGGSGLTPQHFKRLKFILLSGERINPPDLVDWYAWFGERIQLVNLWGTSETTLAKTCYFIQPTSIHKERIPVGKPIKGAGVIIFNEQMQICKPMVVGDIYIRTPYRTLGYYNHQALNRERFIPNPLGSSPDDLLHKTGDRGRFLPDGNIEVLGRKDRQVKIYGIRIELEEIESVLMKYPPVKKAVVIKKELTENNHMLCAYILEKPGSTSPDDGIIPGLKKYAAARLPGYMVPAVITRLEEIPLTTNGKVDYARLPDPLLREQEKEYMLPRNEVEMKLAKFWSEILGIKKVSARHHFFQLGGNSLNVMSLISKIHREFDVRISLGEILNNPTLERQAEIIRESGKEKYFTLEHVELKKYYEMSTAQEGIYLQQQIHPTSVSYNMPSVVELEGKLEPDKLEKTFIKLIRRHESLRTSFIIIGEKPFQVIRSRVEFAIAHYHLKENENPGDERKEEIQRIIDRFVRPFDLTCASLMRVGLIELEPTRYILIIDFHHIISDGISNEIFVNEAIALYNGEKLPGLRHRYKDYSEWQNRRKKAGILKRQEEYWLKEFEGNISPIQLPLDFKRPARRSFEAGSLDFYIGPEETAALKNIALEENATIFILLLAVYNVFLAKISGQEDITVGTVIAGRLHEHTREIIGLFVNLLALRNFTPADMSFRNFLRRVREKTLKAFENQDYPFERLVVKLKLGGDSSRNPIFSTAFDELINTAPSTNNLHPVPPIITVKPYRHGGETSKFDLLLRSLVRPDSILLKFQYLTRLFKKDTIEQFIIYFKEIITQVVEHPDKQLQEISISHGLLPAASSTLNDYKSDFAF